MQPKVLFIDWDGTLSNSRFWERWRTNPKELIKYQLIEEVLFRDSKDLLVEWMCGYKTAGNVVQYIADVTGLLYEELITELQHSCENMVFIDEDLIHSIQKIRDKGIGVVVATDNMDTFSRWTAPALKLDDYFDGTLLSVDRGALKAYVSADGTSPFFNHFFLSTGIKPNETVLLDNSPDNRAVESFGMKFLQVTDKTPLSSRLLQFT
jgi:FMN phosphatase YigB (HAD superfamily)